MGCLSPSVSSRCLSLPFLSYHSCTIRHPRIGHCVVLSGFSRVSLDEQARVTRKAHCNIVTLSSCVSPAPKQDSLDFHKAALDKVGALSFEGQRPYAISFGKYVVQEAVLDEEYWAAAWLRAESYSEERAYFRYIDNHRKRFAEQEFTALKRRCFGRQGHLIKCICLLAVTEEAKDACGKSLHHTLRDRVVGTLDIRIRQLLRGETFPTEVACATLLPSRERERTCGYIANVCVAKSSRRQGIASSLLKVAVKVAKSWKLNDLYVHVNVNNLAAQQLYLKTGFQVVEDAVSNLSVNQEQLLSMYV